MKNFRKTIIDEFAKSTRKKKIRENRSKTNKKKQKLKNAINERLKSKSTKKRDEKFENVANSTKSYFVVLKTTKFIELKNELNKTTKSRILLQVNKIFANLVKYELFLFFAKNFNFYNKKNRNNNFRFFEEKCNDNFEKNEIVSKKNFRQ